MKNKEHGVALYLRPELSMAPEDFFGNQMFVRIKFQDVVSEFRLRVLLDLLDERVPRRP